MRVVVAISSLNPTQWCGVAAGLGGVLWEALGGVTFLAPDRFLYFVKVETFLVSLLFLVALVGLYVTLRGRRRILGRIGLFVALCASLWHWVNIVGEPNFVIIYVLEKGLPVDVLNWLPYVCAGAVVIGVAVLKVKTLGRWSTLPLVVGMCGEAFYATDYGHSVGLLLANLVLGVLFGLSWMALGYALWREGSGRQRVTLAD